MSYLDLARGRYSCREFEDRAVEQAVVDAIVEAGRIAPSACNNHPTRVMVLDTPELLEKAAACQPRFARDGSIFGAPLIFLICSVTDDAWVRPYDQMNSSEIDTSIVCDQMMMEATEQGLGTCWVCHFKPEVAQEQFNLPKGVYPYHMLVCGYPADHIADPEHREARTIPLPNFLLKKFFGTCPKTYLLPLTHSPSSAPQCAGLGFLCCAPLHSHKKGPASCGSFLGTKL